MKSHFFAGSQDFIKTKNNPDAIPVILAVVARPYLCYVSESKGFGFCQITSFWVTAAMAAATAAEELYPRIKYPVRDPPLTPIN